MSTNDGGKGNGNGKNNNDDARYDPNPGGMSEWEEDDTAKDPQNNENFLDSLRSWIRSDEGREDIQTYTLSLCIALLLRLTIIEPRYIPSLSMYPTFDVGDQLAVEKVTKRIRPFNRNEVVVFNPPESFRQIMSSNYGVETKKSKEALIKRIVAIEVRTT
jgi:adenine specific DNA methylase Mod